MSINQIDFFLQMNLDYFTNGQIHANCTLMLNNLCKSSKLNQAGLI
jgi:hypothetical protein